MPVREPDPSEVQTVARAHEPEQGGVVASFALVTVEGPAQGQIFSIDGSTPGRALIGTSEACLVRLTDPSVSRRHAALERSGRRLRITDLGSTNGTFVDGVGVLDAWLQGGELVRLGSSALRVEPIAPLATVPLPGATSFGRFIGESPTVRALYPLFARLAQSRVPVVIEGETGTGKEVLAEALHEQGPRPDGPFVVFDCTATPANLLEAELFGHERGAFTGASAQRKGLVELAHRGTLLIDEIGDLDLALQSKLLRVIDRCQLRRVGGSETIDVDARILAATRRDLDREVQAGRFRDDLYHRLAIGRVELPPLRNRREDIAVLARHFCRSFGADDRALPAELLASWLDYLWPGNVRELRNAVARRIELGDADALGAGMFAEQHAAPDPLREPPERAVAPDFLDSVIAERLPLVPARQKVVAEFERRYVENVLAEHGGHVGHAAAASGLARRYFQIVRNRGGR
jgi:DNA-binding NtrC family response regulator